MKNLKSLLTVSLLVGLVTVAAVAKDGHNKGNHGYENDSTDTSVSRECKHYERNEFRAAMKDVNLTDEQETSKDDLVTTYRDAKHDLLDDLTRSERKALRTTCQSDESAENETCVSLTSLEDELETDIIELLTTVQVTEYEEKLLELEVTCSES